MKSDVGFLEDLRDDLAEVAERETILRSAPGLARASGARPPARSGRGPLGNAGRRPSRRVLILAAAAFVAIAGVVGYFVTRGGAPFGPSTQAALRAGARAQASPGLGARDGASLQAFVPASGAHTGSSQVLSGDSGAPAPTPAGSGTTVQEQEAAVSLAGPLIVKTAELSIVVPKGHFTEVFNRASAIAGPLGGFVASSSSAGTSSHSGELTIRVPSTQFDQALAALRALGRVDAQSIGGQDVTAHYVDLNARLKTWEAQEAALLRLMAKAVSVTDTLRVQAQLQRVQLTIEQIKGQIRVLDDQTSNATIAIAIREATPKKHVQTNAVKNPSVGTAFRRSVAGLLNVVVAVVVGFGYTVPIALLLVLVWLVTRRIRRRRFAAA